MTPLLKNDTPTKTSYTDYSIEENVFIENDLDLFNKKNVLDFKVKHYKKLTKENKDKLLDNLILNKFLEEYKKSEYKILRNQLNKKIIKLDRGLFKLPLIIMLKALKNDYDNTKTAEIRRKNLYQQLDKLITKFEAISTEEEEKLKLLNKYLSLNPVTRELIETETEFDDNYVLIDTDNSIYLHGNLIHKLNTDDAPGLTALINNNETFVKLIQNLFELNKLRPEFNFLKTKVDFKYISDENIDEILSEDGELLKTFLSILFHKSKNAQRLFSKIPASFIDKTETLADTDAAKDESERHTRSDVSNEDISVFINSSFIYFIRYIEAMNLTKVPFLSLQKLTTKLKELIILEEKYIGNHLLQSILLGSCSADATRSLKLFLDNTSLSVKNLAEYEITEENLLLLKTFFEENFIEEYDEKKFFINTDGKIFKKYLKYKLKYLNLRKSLKF